MMKELPDEIYTKIEKWSEEGNNFFEREQFTQALGKYEAALQLVPEPKLDWEASTWLYTSIGDVHFSEEIFDKAKDSYHNALNCPDGIHNPYINLSLGQTLYELEEFEEARKFLLLAYMSEGHEIFEDENPKYIKHIADLIEPQ